MSTDTYPRSGAPVTTQPDYPALEATVLAREAATDTFHRSLRQREGCKVWSFYDGPPFANGLPHYGHLLTGYVKDVYPRFHTMLGEYVERRFGWDTHGLPAELQTMKELGLTQKHEVEALGVAAFNEAAEASVLRYVDEWERYVVRQNRWVDFQDGYKTLDPGYMESELWAFKTLHERGLVYEGFKVLPYCWFDETPLSNHEMHLDDAYRERTDVAATVAFTLTGARAAALNLAGTRVLAWTTTPWTLSANLLLAVNANLTYVVLGTDKTTYLLERDAVARYAAALGFADADTAMAAVTATLTGADLHDVAYEPLYPYLADTVNAFRVVTADFVTAGEGTGVVHLAPAYGADDQRVCEAYGVPVRLTLDEGGRFTTLVPELTGRLWLDVTDTVLTQLRERDALVEAAPYTHNYPHCWRCDNPLLFKAVTSWFVATTKLQDRMVELAGEVTWEPAHVGQMMHNWLSNTQDWGVSRNRYWGTPLPVWQSDDPRYPRVDVYGSVAELEAAFGVPVPNLHRQYLDVLTRPNPNDPTGLSMMRRVNDVFDVWFDSASMPFAQQHFPFENQVKFEASAPADFVVEYVGQVRGWFYVMHVLSTALFDRPAFKNVLSHGIVLGSDGKKMSKKLKNYPDVYEMFDTHGSDMMRWFLLSSTLTRGGDLAVKAEGVRDAGKAFMNPLWHTYNFFTVNANAAGVTAQPTTGSDWLPDTHVLYLLGQLTHEVKSALLNFDSMLACQLLGDFMETLTNWYVRGNRHRFVEGDQVAYDTLYTVLTTLCRLAAPLTPLLTDTVWVGLTGADSVHLTDYPTGVDLPTDDVTVAEVAFADLVTTAGNRLRKQLGLRSRQPLARVVVLTQTPVSERLRALVRQELNVKAVVTVTDDQANLFERRHELRLNGKVLGPRLGQQMQQVFAAVKAGSWRMGDGHVYVGERQLQVDEYTLTSTTVRPEVTTLADGTSLLYLDTHLDDALLMEGLYRDVLHEVQVQRKGQGLTPDMTAGTVTVSGGTDMFMLVNAYGSQLQARTRVMVVQYAQAAAAHVELAL